MKHLNRSRDYADQAAVEIEAAIKHVRRSYTKADSATGDDYLQMLYDAEEHLDNAVEIARKELRKAIRSATTSILAGEQPEAAPQPVEATPAPVAPLRAVEPPAEQRSLGGFAATNV